MNPFQLHLLNVGQGEAIIIDFPDGDFALIDGGPAEAEPVISQALADRVERGSTFRFAAYTHWDADHIGALPSLLSTYVPEAIFRPNIDFDLIGELCESLNDSAMTDVLGRLAELESNIVTMKLGARNRIPDIGDEVEIWTLAPSPTTSARIRTGMRGVRSTAQAKNILRGFRNEVSLTLWLKVYGRALLLVGEANADKASELRSTFDLARYHIHEDPRAIWIKLGHHGSKTSTSPELIQFFSRRAFVASASHGARHGHPHPRVLGMVRDQERGQAMCTKLGRGCALIQEQPADYSAQDVSWTDTPGWKQRVNKSNENCYGTITVTITSAGYCTVTGEHLQTCCPFGGPTTGRVVFAAPRRGLKASGKQV
jgi:competence protein ComEC